MVFAFASAGRRSDPDHVSDNAGQLPLLPDARAHGDEDGHEDGHRDGDGDEDGHAEDFVVKDGECLSGEVGGSYCELPEGHPGPDDQLAANAVASLRMLTNYTKAYGNPCAAALPHLLC